MIRTYTYGCDGGAIMIGNESSRVCVQNDFGDGSHEVTVYSYDAKYLFDSDHFTFVGTVEGYNVNVYDYDCLKGDELTDPEHILCKLNAGRYAVFVNDGDVVLVQWD